MKKVLAESGHTTGRALPDAARVRTVSWSLRRVSYEFLGETFTFNAPALFILALVVGLIGGTYGIGGGAIIAPFLAAIFELPIYTIAGAALLGTFLTSVAGVGFYSVIAPFYPNIGPVAPDWALGALFGLGGFAGMYIGARLQKILLRPGHPHRPGGGHYQPSPAVHCGVLDELSLTGRTPLNGGNPRLFFCVPGEKGIPSGISFLLCPDGFGDS